MYSISYGVLTLVCAQSLSCVWLFATPWILACTKLLRPWDFQGKSTGVGCHFLLQGIFPTQGLNPGLSHCRRTLYYLSHQGSPYACVCLFNNAIPIIRYLNSPIHIFLCLHWTFLLRIFMSLKLGAWNVKTKEKVNENIEKTFLISFGLLPVLF